MLRTQTYFVLAALLDGPLHGYAIVKRAENASFTTGLDEAFAALAKAKLLGYDDVLKTHGILFGAVYPWAGQDRTEADHQEGPRHFRERAGNPRRG